MYLGPAYIVKFSKAMHLSYAIEGIFLHYYKSIDEYGINLLFSIRGEALISGISY